MENLDLITVKTCCKDEDCFNFIGENYSKHCIFSSIFKGTMLDYFPLKFCKNVGDLSDLRDRKYNHKVEYLSCWINNITEPTNGCWDEHREIFDQCCKLKQISFESDIDSFPIAFGITDPSVDLEQYETPKVWKEMAAYLKKRGIKIVQRNKIFNDDFISKVAKEIGIKWRLEFY
jgi:hypothetical protein